MTDLLVSDVHLRGVDDPRQTDFIRFLERRADEVQNLFVVGDLMDLWFGMKPVLVRQYLPLLRQLRRFSRAGIGVRYLEGNHDFHLRPYVEDAVGAEVHSAMEWTFGGRRTYLYHGDGLDAGDVKYRVLKRIVRSPAFRRVTALMPGSLAWWLGTRFSSASRGYLGRDRPQFEAQKEFARSKIAEGFDVVVMGHAHTPGLFPLEAGARKGLFVNTGDWLTNFTVVEFSDGRFRLVRADGTPLESEDHVEKEVA
ncbi:MAG: UDP-2,3-diacylglucosamine diphosphatase [Nitrospirae bacterium]|nr:UDP-2,3-diacylglucosamine diphosphatase [Nitrospirota bacterium]